MLGLGQLVPVLRWWAESAFWLSCTYPDSPCARVYVCACVCVQARVCTCVHIHTVKHLSLLNVFYKLNGLELSRKMKCKINLKLSCINKCIIT